MGLFDLLLALAAATAGLLVGRLWSMRRRLAASPTTDLRHRLRTIARGLPRGRPGFVRMGPGLVLQLAPPERDLEGALKSGEAVVAREARGGPLVRFTLADLIAAGHPAAASLLRLAGPELGALPPERVVITSAPALVRAAVREGFEAEGVVPALEEPFSPTAADPFGRLTVETEGRCVTVPLADLVAEAVGSVTPLALVARDRAHRARAKLMAPETAPATPGAEDADGESHVERRLVPVDWASAHLPEGCYVDHGGWVEAFVRTGASGEAWVTASDPEALRAAADEALAEVRVSCLSVALGGEASPRRLVLVGRHAGSVASHPALLAAAAEASGLFAGGARVRVRVDHPAMCCLAEPGADEPSLMEAREVALEILRRLEIDPGGAMHLDLTTSLATTAAGWVDLWPVGTAYFAAVERERVARDRGRIAEAARARGEALLLLGEPAGARAHLEEALRLEPADLETQLLLGTVLNELEAWEEAEAVLRAAVKAAPEHPAVNNNLGVAYRGLRRDAEARLFFEKAAELLPEDPTVRVNLGRVAFDAGDLEEAERRFDEALVRAPEHEEALLGKVLVAVRRGEVDTARARLQEALARLPASPSLMALQYALEPQRTVH